MEHLQSIQSIFRDQLYTIPDYQRGYAWEQQQWQDLWDDLELLDSDQEHYTGTLVIHPTGEDRIRDDNGDSYKRYDVVDGQQRLTTLSILIQEITAQFEQLGETGVAANMRARYIATTQHGDLLPKLTLNRDTNEYYKKNVISKPEGLAATPKIMSEKRLMDAKTFFAQCFTEQKTLLGNDFPAWLERTGEKVITQMKLTVYVVPKQSDVGVIFEVMNNRGKPLTDMEKVKNYLLYVCAKLSNCGGEALANDVNQSWKYIYETIMDCGGFGWMEDALLRYHWLFTQNYRTKDWAGSNSIKQKFSLKNYRADPEALRDDIRSYVSKLRDSCKAYCDIMYPERDHAFSYIADPKQRRKVVEYSGKLTRMNTTATFAPLLMAAQLKGVDGAQYLKLLEICEKYAFRVFRMLEKRANAGQSNLYKTAYEYYTGSISEQQAYNNIHWQLTYFCPQQDFEEAVDEVENWYDWIGIKYLLFEYELHLAGRANIHLDWKAFQKKDKKDTIEHIVPQTPDKPYWKKRWKKSEIEQATHDIGNLVVTLDNSSYSNKGFDEKKGAPGIGVCYSNSALFSEKELAIYEEWDYESYLLRREKISNWMKDRWFIEDYADASFSITDSDEDEETE